MVKVVKLYFLEWRKKQEYNFFDENKWNLKIVKFKIKKWWVMVGRKVVGQSLF